MTRQGRLALLLAPLLLGGCVTDFYDLRLERVLPVEAVELSPDPPYPWQNRQHFSGGIVAEFSSERDMRRMAGRSSTSFQSLVEPCAGRSHTEDTFYPAVGFSSGDFFDEFGYISDAGQFVPSSWREVSPPVGVPRDGRFFVKLPISLRAFVSVRDEYGQLSSERKPELDLPLAPDDLCVLARGAPMIWLPWRSNTVVIPFAAIRAALDVAPALPAPNQGAPAN
jgi:hypothetical protein